MTEIGLEYELIDFVYKHQLEYFDFNFGLIATEVDFHDELKTVDMLGEGIHEYKAIEFKREDISEEDFYNVRNIIDNSKYDKPMKGLLIGTGISTELLEKVDLYNDIDYLIVGDVVYNKEIDNNGKPRKYKIEDTYRVECLRKFFACSVGHDNINSIYSNGNIIFRYKLNNRIQVDLLLFGDYCEIEIYEKCGIIGDRWNKIGEYKRVRYYEIDEIIFGLENKDCIEYIKKRNDELRKNGNYANSLGLLSKYIDIDRSAYKYYFKNNILETDSEKGIMFTPAFKNRGYYIYPLKYSYLLLKKLKNEKIYNIERYNYVTILESTRLILGNKVYKPLIKVSYKNGYIILDFTIRLSNKKEITQSYKIKRLEEVKNFEFYLIADIDIILNFERCVKKDINDEVTIDEKYNDFIGTHKYEKFRNAKEHYKVKSIRDIIENITEEDIKLMDRYKSYF